MDAPRRRARRQRRSLSDAQMPRADAIAAEQREREQRRREQAARRAARLPIHRIAAPTDRPDRWIPRCSASPVEDAAATSDPDRVTCAACAGAAAPIGPLAESRSPIRGGVVPANPERFYKTHVIMLHICQRSPHFWPAQDAIPAQV